MKVEINKETIDKLIDEDGLSEAIKKSEPEIDDDWDNKHIEKIFGCCIITILIFLVLGTVYLVVEAVIDCNMSALLGAWFFSCIIAGIIKVLS